MSKTVSYARYRDEVSDACENAGIDASEINTFNADKVTQFMRTETLAAVVNEKVVEDYSVILNNSKAGLPQPFLPFWVSACDKELVERLLTDYAEEN